MKHLIIIPLLLLTSCAVLDTFQSKPSVQFVETEAIKLAASYFSNGGSVDSAWGIAKGLSIVGDAVAFSRQQNSANPNALAAQTAARAVKEFAGSKTAVNGLAGAVADLVVSASPKTPIQRAEIVQAISKGIGDAATTKF